MIDKQLKAGSLHNAFVIVCPDHLLQGAQNDLAHPVRIKELEVISHAPPPRCDSGQYSMIGRTLKTIATESIASGSGLRAGSMKRLHAEFHRCDGPRQVVKDRVRPDGLALERDAVRLKLLYDKPIQLRQVGGKVDRMFGPRNSSSIGWVAIRRGVDQGCLIGQCRGQ